MAHSRIRKFNTRDTYPEQSLDNDLCQAVVARGKGLEINTSPLGNGLAEPCPGLYILRRYRALGGETLVFGSDAHQTPRVGQHFEEARQLALAAGFTRLARYRERQVVGWIPL